MGRVSTKIVLQVENAREMLATEEMDLAQLLAGWVIREMEGRRQIAENALTTKQPCVTIVQNENGPLYDNRVNDK